MDFIDTFHYLCEGINDVMLYLFTYMLIHSVTRHALGVYYAPGTILGTETRI